MLEIYPTLSGASLSGDLKRLEHVVDLAVTAANAGELEKLKATFRNSAVVTGDSNERLKTCWTKQKRPHEIDNAPILSRISTHYIHLCTRISCACIRSTKVSTSCDPNDDECRAGIPLPLSWT